LIHGEVGKREYHEGCIGGLAKGGSSLRDVEELACYNYKVNLNFDDYVYKIALGLGTPILNNVANSKSCPYVIFIVIHTCLYCIVVLFRNNARAFN
jgi:hypothetical protein